MEGRPPSPLVARPVLPEPIRNVDDALRTKSVAASTTGAIAGTRHPKRPDEVPGRRVASDIVPSSNKHDGRASRLNRAPSERRGDSLLGDQRLTYERLQQYAVAHAALTAAAKPGPKSTSGSVTFRRRAATMLPLPLPQPPPPQPLAPSPPGQAAALQLAPSPSAAQHLPPSVAASATGRLAFTTPGVLPPWLASPANGRPSSARRPTSPRVLIHRLGTFPQQLPHPGAALGPGPRPASPAPGAPPPERAFGPRAAEYPSRLATSPRGPASVSGGFPDMHPHPHPHPRTQPPLRPQPPDAGAGLGPGPGSVHGAGGAPGRTLGWQPHPPPAPQQQPQPPSLSSPLVPSQQPHGFSRAQTASSATRDQSPVKGHPRIAADARQLQQHQPHPQPELGSPRRQESLRRQPSSGPGSPRTQWEWEWGEQPRAEAQPDEEQPQLPPPRTPTPPPHTPPPPTPPPQEPVAWQLLRPRSPERRPASAGGPRRVVGLRDVPAAQLLAARALGGPGGGGGGGAAGGGPRRRSSDGGTHADWWQGGADSEASYPLTAVTDRYGRGGGGGGGGEDDMTPSEAAVWLERMAHLEAEVAEEREFRRKYEEELQRLAAAVGAARGAAGAGGAAPLLTSSGRLLTGARAAAAAVMRYRAAKQP